MNDAPPSFFSLSFHTRFFPSLLWRRLRPRKEEYQSPFSNHIPLELTILVIVSKVAAIAGLGAGISRGSIIGWGVGILGLAVFAFFLVDSIRSQMGIRPSFDSFSFGIFFFFVVLGITVGLFEGTLLHSKSLAGWGGLAGFVAGYGGGNFCRPQNSVSRLDRGTVQPLGCCWDCGADRFRLRPIVFSLFLV